MKGEISLLLYSFEHTIKDGEMLAIQNISEIQHLLNTSL